ncbi:Methyltransferase-like protein 13 [Homalodisca vitripennis]|nr:Methyltransferase-like protein 13 [Homalodisca vitripennis]
MPITLYFKLQYKKYGEYPELCGILHKYIRPRDKILVIGCGNSSLSSDLYDVGYKQIMNIDVSGVVIKQMKAKGKNRPGLEYQKMDATNTTFADGEFNVVLDKGTLDAMMPDSSPETLKRIDKLFAEVDRVLAPLGRYICVSLLQHHILLRLANHCSELGWMLRICRCHEAEHKSDDSGGFVFPVFVVVCTKLKSLAGTKSVLEVCLCPEQVQRMATVEDAMAAVKAMQDTALVCSGLNRCNIANTGEVVVELSRPGDVTPRYTITVADSPNAKDVTRMKFAAFIVPQGREREWLFGTPEGRQVLLENSAFDRLAVIRLHREHKYENLKAVQDETAETVIKLAPDFKDASQRPKIPFLTVAADLGNVTVIARGQSQISGDFIIEDAEGAEKEWYRRLVFLVSQNTVQSEAKLKTVERNGEIKHVVDVSYLACDHHKYMTMGVSMVNVADRPYDILVLGLGGGGLCTYIRNCFPTVRITAVDIDPAIYEVATKYFDLEEDEQLKVVIEDGLDYLKNSANKGTKFSAVLFDLDSKDTSKGLSCPPAVFLEPEVLSAAAECLTDTGLFVLNFVCRVEDIRQTTKSKLEKLYKDISSVKLDQDVNEIFFCWKSKSDNTIEKAAENINAIVKNRKIQEDDLIDLEEISSLIRIK